MYKEFLGFFRTDGTSLIFADFLAKKKIFGHCRLRQRTMILIVLKIGEGNNLKTSLGSYVSRRQGKKLLFKI